MGYGGLQVRNKNLGNARKVRLIGVFLGGWLGITLVYTIVDIKIGLSSSIPYGLRGQYLSWLVILTRQRIS